MATITKPMALDESFNTTESTSRNQADVLAGIEEAIRQGFGQVASAVEYDNIDSGLTADNVQDAIDEVDDTVDGLVDDVAEISSDIESTQIASGNPITLTDAAPINAESLVVELEPQQDLHGYDFPWVGGAGKNKLPMTVDGLKAINTAGTWSGNVYTREGCTFEVLTDSDNNVVGIKVNAPSSHNTATFSFGDFTRISGTTYILNGCPANGTTASYKLRWNDVGYDYGNGRTTDGTAGTGTVAIDIMSNTAVTNLIFYPMIRLSTETDPTFAPYSNICPISGYEGVEVEDVGKNLWSEGNVSGTLSNRIDIIFPAGTYNMSAVVTSSDTDDSKSIVIISDANGAELAYLHFDRGVRENFSFTVNKPIATIRFYASDNYVKSEGDTFTYSDIQIEKGSTATTYEPYQSRTASVTFGQTVYGGKSDFTEGGTDDEYTSVDMGALDWFKTEGGGVTYFQSDTLMGVAKPPINDSTAANCLSSVFRFVAWNSGVVASCVAAIAGVGDVVEGRISCQIHEYDNMTATEFKAAMSGVQLVYEKATHTTISTPPTDLKLLQGTNNITTNGTTINLGYQPDNVIGEVKGEIEKCAVDAEFMQFTDGTDTFTDVNLSLDAFFHTVSVVGSKIEQKRFICFEVMDKMGGALQGILASCIAFTDGAKTPSGTAFRAYIESLQMYVNFRIYGSGGSYTLAYQSETSFSASAFFVRLRMMNNL